MERPADVIAIDTSAIVAIVLGEPEADIFDELIAEHSAIIGTPTPLGTRMVLGSLIPSFVDEFLDGLVARPSVCAVEFTLDMYRAAADAFSRYGKGRGHAAHLNFGDRRSHAVAGTHALPLLFKGNDFGHTDIVPAYTPAP